MASEKKQKAKNKCSISFFSRQLNVSFNGNRVRPNACCIGMYHINLRKMKWKLISLDAFYFLNKVNQDNCCEEWLYGFFSCLRDIFLMKRNFFSSIDTQNRSEVQHKKEINAPNNQTNHLIQDFSHTLKKYLYQPYFEFELRNLFS